MDWIEIGLTVSVKWYSKKRNIMKSNGPVKYGGYWAMHFLYAFDRFKPKRFSNLVIGYLLTVIRVCHFGICPKFIFVNPN
jgi:hypothetical protein